MRRAFTLIEAMIVVAIIAIICGLVASLIVHDRGIHAGFVVGKAHHDAYTTFIVVGKTVVPQNHPEHWTIDLAFDGKTNDWDIDQGTFDAAKPGQWYDHDTETLSDKPVPEKP